MKHSFIDFIATISSAVILIILGYLTWNSPVVEAAGASPCINDPVTFGVIEKRLLPLPSECPGYDYCGRGEQKTGEYAPSPACVTPKKIVLHTTHDSSTTVDQVYDYFANGSDGRHVGSHFVIDKSGKILQMIEMGSTQVEYGQAVGPTKDHISIEMTASGNFNNKNEMPEAQYKAVLQLVKTLMDTYQIPLSSDDNNARYEPSSSTTGVFGHYNFYGPAGDPGVGWMKDFRSDLPTASGLLGVSTGTVGGGSRTAKGCWVTKVGNPNEDDKPICETNLGGSGGPCQAAPPPPSNVKQAIIDKWGIRLEIPDYQLKLAWQEFHEIDCTGFLQDIKGAYVGSWANGYAQQFSCPSDGDVDVMFSNQWDGEFMKAILTHELTHVWQFCSQRGEQNRILDGSAYQEEGGLTNYSRTGCGFGVSLLNEDHADTIALYLNPEQGELTCGNGAPNPFANGRYPVHRNVAETGVGH